MTNPMSMICRLSLVFQALVTTLLAHLAPNSLAAELVWRAGAFGQMASLAFSVFVTIAVLDVVVNDLMPDNYALGWAARYRWLGVCGIGTVYLFLAATATVGPVSTGDWVLIGAYVGMAFFCFWWSTACVMSDYRDAMEQSC